MANLKAHKEISIELLPLPPILRQIILPLARKTTLQNLQVQGMGRHSASEVYQIGIIDAIAGLPI